MANIRSASVVVARSETLSTIDQVHRRRIVPMESTDRQEVASSPSTDSSPMGVDVTSPVPQAQDAAVVPPSLPPALPDDSNSSAKPPAPGVVQTSRPDGTEFTTERMLAALAWTIYFACRWWIPAKQWKPDRVPPTPIVAPTPVEPHRAAPPAPELTYPPESEVPDSGPMVHHWVGERLQHR